MTFCLTFVEDLLDLQKMRIGDALELVKDAFDFNQVLSMIEAIFSPQAESKKVKLSCTVTKSKTDTSPVVLPKLIGDSRRLQQVLVNLVKNALKFTSDGIIRVNASYEGETSTLLVEVIDTGKGIAAEDFPKLFTRFGKLHRTAKMNSEGIGLGLTIVKQIVESQGGTISVSSQGVNKGSCFAFTLPMA